MSTQPILPKGHVYLVGAGIVGRAILRAHTDANVSVWIIDQMSDRVHSAVDDLGLDATNWRIHEPRTLPDGALAIHVQHQNDAQPRDATIVIESILERLDAKQTFFANAPKLFGDNAILCSNTSNLRISEIAGAIDVPSQFAGMHFFMPVHERPATEIVRGRLTSDSTIEACRRHAMRIHKSPLVVRDGPGFIVNRMLSPYLNEALRLLCRDVPADQIERAAIAYGMPISPLELIDHIGTRTMFDAGRAFWQAFPKRIDPCALLGALLKAGRNGRSNGGLYDYHHGQRSEQLPSSTQQLCERYRRNPIQIDDRSAMLLLAIPMWIEAAMALRDGVAESLEQINDAMVGGLGFQAQPTWSQFFDGVGSRQILKTIEMFQPTTKSLTAPPQLLAQLHHRSPAEALEHFRYDDSIAES